MMKTLLLCAAVLLSAALPAQVVTLPPGCAPTVDLTVQPMRIGQPSTMCVGVGDVLPPGGSFGLGLGLVDPALPWFGTCLMRTLPTWVWDVSANRCVTLQVPNDYALVGTKFYSQAALYVYGTPTGVSNGYEITVQQ